MLFGINANKLLVPRKNSAELSSLFCLFLEAREPGYFSHLLSIGRLPPLCCPKRAACFLPIQSCFLIFKILFIFTEVIHSKTRFYLILIALFIFLVTLVSRTGRFLVMIACKHFLSSSLRHAPIATSDR